MKKFFIDHNSSTRKAITKINQLGGQSLIVVERKNVNLLFKDELNYLGSRLRYRS